MNTTVQRGFSHISERGASRGLVRELAVETPVAVEVNGIGYAVLMTSPADLEDLAVGFLLSERIIDAATDVTDIQIQSTRAGVILRTKVAAHASDRISQRVRHRTADTSCGLCGIKNLHQALRPFPRLAPPWYGNDRAVFLALAELEQLQTLNQTTGAVHGAARCAVDGKILELREDVGRHNAFDKLIGAMLRNGEGWENGFALLTSRCSYELVEKAVLSSCPMLATISAPTDLAARRAEEGGLALRVLARPDALLANLP